MDRPWLPPRLNFTGIALPALTALRTFPLSTGWKKPVHAKTTLYVTLFDAVFPALSVAPVQLAVIDPTVPLLTV